MGIVDRILIIPRGTFGAFVLVVLYCTFFTVLATFQTSRRFEGISLKT